MGSGVAGNELLERARHGIGERLGQPDRQRAAEGVSIPRPVFGGRPPLLAGDGDLDRPAFSDQGGPQVRRRLIAGRLAAQLDLAGAQVADAAQHVVQLVGRAGPPPVGEVLDIELDVGEHAGVEQLAEFLGAEQVGEQVAVERQGRRPPLGERGVALVHVGGDPVEQQALGHRRRLRRLDGDDPYCPGSELPEDVAQCRHVEHVLQALS